MRVVKVKRLVKKFKKEYGKSKNLKIGREKKERKKEDGTL